VNKRATAERIITASYAGISSRSSSNALEYKRLYRVAIARFFDRRPDLLPSPDAERAPED